MQIQYVCKNINCGYPGNSQYKIRFNSESIMDINNFAIPFCRFCKKEMVDSFLFETLDNSHLICNKISHNEAP